MTRADDPPRADDPRLPKVLVVDDRVENRITLEAVLSELEVEVVSAASGPEALGLLLEHTFAVVLMDVQMPEMDGFEVVDVMRRHPRTSHLPVVFVTAISTERRFVARGYEVGAVDYLFKPLDPEILRSKVRVFVELFNMTRLLEEKNAELEAMAARLRDAAITDPLTGLHNRRFLTETVGAELAIAHRSNDARRSGRLRDVVNTDVGFLMVDIDHFKRINDGYGHDAGDRVLAEFADRLRQALRDSDTAVRWGGEEFLVLLRRTEPEGLAVVAERIRAAIAEVDFTPRTGTGVRITCSVGYCRYPAPDTDSYSWEEIVSIADHALYRAKQRGRNTWVGVEILTVEGSPADRASVISDLERAVSEGRVRWIDREEP